MCHLLNGRSQRDETIAFSSPLLLVTWTKKYIQSLDITDFWSKMKSPPSLKSYKFSKILTWRSQGGCRLHRHETLAWVYLDLAASRTVDRWLPSFEGGALTWLKVNSWGWVGPFDSASFVELICDRGCFIGCVDSAYNLHVWIVLSRWVWQSRVETTLLGQ